MNTKVHKINSAIVSFVTMLTAQAALAYYNPSTGTWLSRDPVGEPGFQLVQGAHVASQVMLVPAADQSSRWIKRDPLPGHAPDKTELLSGPNLYAILGNDPVTKIDLLGTRTVGIIAGTLVIDRSCAKCSELLKNYKYIDEDEPGLAPAPTQPAEYAADAVYIPVGVAFKINDLGRIVIKCDCCTHCVGIIVIQGASRWELPATSPPPGVNWPGNAAPYTVPGAMECAEISGRG